MKRFALAFCAALASVFLTAQERAAGVCDSLFSISPEYDGHAMQAFSIRDGVVYVGYDSGLCRSYDFRTGRQISGFPLGCRLPSNHCGNLNFADGLLYVSGDLKEKACYVQEVTPSSARTVQTIRFRLSGPYGGSQVVTDTARSRIVYMQRRFPEINRADNEFIVSEFRLPDVGEGDVTFTDSDTLRTYRLEKYFPIYQGACISGGKLYQSFGGPVDWPSSEGTGFAVFDLSDGRLLKTVHVPFPEEPQSVMVHDGRILMNFGGAGMYGITERPLPETLVAAYVWPSCHDDSLAHSCLWSEGQGEWEIIRRAKPRFEGHLQPKEPLWGYEMDDDPEVVGKWIETALEYGVNTFIYDWYWYGGGPFLEGALDDGFLKAPGNEKMNFFVMWANHDVQYDYWNPYRYPGNGDILFSADFSREDYVKIVDRIISRYFSRPNYLKIDGKPVFAIYSYANLVRSFGSVAKAAEGLDLFRARARKAGYGGIYLMDIRGEGGRLTEARLSDTRMRIDSLGVDGIAFYNMGGFNTDYLKHGRRALQLRSDWDRAFDADVFPCVSVAWDDTPRFPAKGKADVTGENASPETFRAFLGEALSYARKHPSQPPLVTINAWNEWVEGSYLLPDRRNGFGYLEAVRDALADSRHALDVMSFNIRNGKAADGDNCWENRREQLSAFLNSELPDVVGLQEAHGFQLADITVRCPEYESFGAGRDDGINGEQTAVLWRKSRLDMLDSGCFWLSETPDVPSSGWDARYLRTATWVLFEDRTSGKRFYFVNTHLDNVGVLAKEKGLELIRRRIAELNGESLPVVLTGDFNSPEGSPIVEEFGRRMSDARRTATVSDSSPSFNAWGDSKRAAAIDYIFHDGFRRCELFRTMDGSFDGRRYLSDHYPVMARLIF